MVTAAAGPAVAAPELELGAANCGWAGGATAVARAELVEGALRSGCGGACCAHTRIWPGASSTSSCLAGASTSCSSSAASSSSSKPAGELASDRACSSSRSARSVKSTPAAAGCAFKKASSSFGCLLACVFFLILERQRSKKFHTRTCKLPSGAKRFSGLFGTSLGRSKSSTCFEAAGWLEQARPCKARMISSSCPWPASETLGPTVSLGWSKPFVQPPRARNTQDCLQPVAGQGSLATSCAAGLPLESALAMREAGPPPSAKCHKT